MFAEENTQMSDLDDEFDFEFDAVDDLALVQALDQVENKIPFHSVASAAGPSIVQRPALYTHQASLNSTANAFQQIDQGQFTATKVPSYIAPSTAAAGKQKQQTSLLDHFKSTTTKTNLPKLHGLSQSTAVGTMSKVDRKNANQNQQQSLLSLDKHHQSKAKAYNPKRPDAVASYHTLDEEAIKTWVYPINYSIRDYQFNIAQSALFSNTLVCLPTGLGKTFIAAVVIYNYLRWFPEGCVVFTAPTKPLVTQQVDACKKITGIGADTIAELTGSKSVETRRVSWSKKRLFFMTPETFRNDIQSNCCDVDKIVLVIFDEAHRASGQYAYCEIIKALERERAVFRVLALSATPANDPKKVQGVIQNLYIERLHLRTEDSFDVVPYIFKKDIQEIVVQASALMNDILAKFLPLLEAPLKRLKQNQTINQDNPATIAPYFLLKARESWRQRKSALPQAVQGMTEGDFGLAHTLAGFRESLFSCGVRSFYDKLHAFTLEIKQKSNSSKRKLELVKNFAFISMMQMIEERMALPDFSSHPKLDILAETVVEHFKQHELALQAALRNGEDGDAADIQRETKVMIFSTMRSSVEEICALLEKHSPLVRPAIFVGQATSGKNSAGMKQKDQLMMMENFRNGLFNVIVATSIGEEGLDIGELDLIICFDNHKSPIRMLQRCGRTGRKRRGKICLLINEGAEQAAVRRARDQYKAVQSSIIDGSRLEMYGGDLAAVLPQECSPECSKEVLVVGKEEEVAKEARKSSKTNQKQSTAQLVDYMTKNRISFKNVPKIDLTTQSHWQTLHLPVVKVEHSALANIFVSTMQFCREQRVDEEKNFVEIVDDTQQDYIGASSGFAHSLPASTHPSKQIPKAQRKKKSKFQFEDLFGEEMSDASDEFLLKDLQSLKKTVIPKNNRSRQILSSSSSSSSSPVIHKPQAEPSVVGDEMRMHVDDESLLKVLDDDFDSSSQIDDEIPPSNSQQNAEDVVSQCLIDRGPSSPILDELKCVPLDGIPVDGDAVGDCPIDQNQVSLDIVNIAPSADESSVKSQKDDIIEAEVSLDEFSDLDLDLSFGCEDDWKACMNIADAAAGAVFVSNVDVHNRPTISGKKAGALHNVSSGKLLKTVADEHVFLAPSGPAYEIQADRVIIPPTPAVLHSQQQSSSSILVPRKRKNVVVRDSSSAPNEGGGTCSVAPSLNGSEVSVVVFEKTPLIVRLERKRQIKRPPPRERGTPPRNPDRIVKPKKKDAAPKEKRPKNLKAETLMELDADVSSGHEQSSDEEGSYLDGDLSGFIASTDPSEYEGNGIAPISVPAFYRESLMDTDLRKFGNKYKFSRGIALRRPVGSATGLAGSSANDSLNSLQDFLVDDDEVEYDSQFNSILDDSFDDSHQPAKKGVDWTNSQSLVSDTNSPSVEEVVVGADDDDLFDF